ncbi:phage holin family protein [Amycolatopsis sp. PS_44_ISF1]|uniref:phage holin family protein n=1 Tax=Amycolatopsis sp. PS_44_ISF1 TaxID=2974917 RepID=UPI0028E00848|nr:phage holin family protein [Amycolatopsis sp. PS_44_ISF1]MDT8910859.1 phage holin family protein [Amycolatopsis sp. PS_44_ISF1]
MSSPKHERTGPDGVGAVPYLPLSSDEEAAAGEQSIGKLVGDATQHLSTLVRAEVELAKAELISEVKKALKGAVFFLIALAVLLYSTYFLFLFVAEILSDWWGVRWPAFLTVFGLMLVTTLVTAFLGWRKVKKLRAPERTIDSVKETAAALKPHRASEGDLPATRA